MRAQFSVPIYGSRVLVVVDKDIYTASRALGSKFAEDGMPTEEDAAASLGMALTNGCGDFAILLTRDSARDINAVCHEIFHLTLSILEYVGEQVEPGHHEPAAYLHGYLCAQIFSRLRLK